MTDADVVAALHRLTDALLAECERTLAARSALHRLDPVALIARTNAREAFNAWLVQQLNEVSGALGGTGMSDEALASGAPARAPAVRQALDEAKAAGRKLDALDAADRDLWRRALALIQQLTNRLPTRAAAYGPRGASVHTTPVARTTSSTV